VLDVNVMRADVLLDAGEDVRRRRGTRIVLGIVVVGVIAVGWGVWRMFLWAPSPEALCDHHQENGLMPTMPEAIIGSRTPPPRARTEREICEWYYTAMREAHGWWDYGRFGRCVMSMERPTSISCLSEL
jgi:hypothetical protein